LVVQASSIRRTRSPERLKLSYGDLSNNISGRHPRLTRGFLTATGARSCSSSTSTRSLRTRMLVHCRQFGMTARQVLWISGFWPGRGAIQPAWCTWPSSFPTHGASVTSVKW